MVSQGIKAIDRQSIHRITSGQVVIDLQTAVKELVENSIDAGATNVEVRFKHYGLKCVEVIDNGAGISETDYENIALKHHTSKLETFSDLTSVQTFGFRGEALSSLCALSEQVTVSTATSATSPLGICLDMDSNGRIKKRSSVARQTGTTVTLTNLFISLPVRRKEFERNVKREFGKALALLNAYALGPCTAGSGVRLTVSNQPEKGHSSVQIKTMGIPSPRASVTALWGPKALDNVVDIDLKFEVEKDRATLRRLQSQDTVPVTVQVKGLISKFAVGAGRTATDRQFFYVNGRPCNMSKIQKAFNEVYRSFNASHVPFIMADFDIPTDAYDVNVSPDKRTILLHSEGNLILALKAALESHFGTSRSTYDLAGSQKTQSLLTQTPSLTQGKPTFKSRVHNDDEEETMDESGKNLDAGDDGLNQLVPMSLSSKKSPTQSLLTPTPSMAKLTFKSRVHNDDEEGSMDKNSDSNNDVLNQFAPMPLSRSSSKKSPTQSSLSSPQPLSSMNDSDGGTDLCNLETDNLDDTSSGGDAMVLDTSQASWNRPLESVATPQLSNSLSPKLDSADDNGHVRKKRKADIGVVSSGRNDISTDHQLEDEEPDGDQTNQRSERTPSLTLLSKESGVIGKVSYIPRKQKDLRQKLRVRLADYARTGSQISVAPVKSDPSEDEDDEDEEDEDVDQLFSDCVEVSGDLPVLRDTELASAIDTGHSDMVIDNIKGSGPSVRTSLPDTVDLTLDEDEDEDPSSLLSQARTSSLATSSAISQVFHPEIIRSEATGADISLKFNIDRVKQIWADRPKKDLGGRRESASEKVLVDAGVNTENDEKAVDALSRVIEKDDFATMDIVGQFNLGFIVVRRRKIIVSDDNNNDPDEMDDLFIVDQHAADEKYNFETLQSTTVIQSQKLLRRQPLELTAADELLAMENVELLRQNGFEIEIDESASVGRLYLAAKPISGSTTFDMKDLEEIIHLMRDRPSGQIVRCSKVRTMFAMRACRKSVMIGMPLDPHHMTTVIRHMGTIDQPWNCPHGRPTMRHLVDVKSSGPDRRLLEHPPLIDWSAL